MLDEEWDGIALLLDKGWKGSFGAAEDRVYRFLLDDYSADQVRVALKALLAKGSPFLPAAAEIVAEIRADVSKPTFAEAFRMIYGPRGVLLARAPYRDGRFEYSHDEAALQRADGMHPLLGAFVRAYGLGRLRTLEVDHERYGEANRRELRRDWEQFEERAERRDVAALTAPRRGELARFGERAEIGSG